MPERLSGRTAHEPLQPLHSVRHQFRRFEQVRISGAYLPFSSETGSEVVDGNPFEAIDWQRFVYGLLRIEFLELDPDRTVFARQQPVVAPEALAGDVCFVLGVMQQANGVQRRADHQNASSSLHDLFEWRALAIAVLERMVRCDPCGQRADSNYTRIGMVAAHSPRPGSDRLMQKAVVARSAGDPFVKYGDLRGIVIIGVGRFEIDVSRQCSFPPDRVKQRLHEHVDSAHNRPNRSQAAMHHQEIPRRDAETSEIIAQTGSGGLHTEIVTSYDAADSSPVNDKAV
jgi:hypothetical protein